MSMKGRQFQGDRVRQITDWRHVRCRPAIGRGSEIYELPQPVSQLVLKELWDAERFKTLLVDGETTTGATRNGVEITVAGVIGSQEEMPLEIEELFTALADLRANVHVGPDAEPFRFYLYHDAETETSCYFRSCTSVKLETDVSNPTVFGYRLVVHADDPALYAE